MTRSTRADFRFDDFDSGGRPADSIRDMMHSASLPPASLPKSAREFDAFLFAPVGDDNNGMSLSVLSALARLDVDPWQEAADLARLPGRAATERLSSLIAALPGRPASQPDPGTISARLVALLPRRTGSSVPPHNGMTGDGGVTNVQAVVRVVAFNLILVVFMLSTQWLAISHASRAQVAQASAAISQASPARSSTPNPGQ